MYEIKDNIIVELLKQKIKNNQHNKTETFKVVKDYYVIVLNTPEYSVRVLREHLNKLDSKKQWHMIDDREILSGHISQPVIAESPNKVTFLVLKPLFEEFRNKVLRNDLAINPSQFN